MGLDTNNTRLRLRVIARRQVGRGGSGRPRKLVQQQAHFDGVAALGQVARPVEGNHRSAGRFGERLAAGVGCNGVLVPMQHQHRAAHALGQGARLVFSHPAYGIGGDECFWIRLEAPRHSVLDEFGGVRLVGGLREEELQEIGVVGAPVGVVEFGPALSRVERPVE